MNATQVFNILREIPESALDSVINTLKDHINAKDKDGDTPLILACRSSLVPLALKLIEKGVDINAKGFHNDTPLILACYHKCEKVAIRLYQLNADINAKDTGGKTAIDYVKEKWAEDAKKRFLDLVEPKTPIEVGMKQPEVVLKPEVKTVQPVEVKTVQPEVKTSKYPFNLVLADYLNQNNISYKVESGFIIPL
jgi:hypothetical protein